MKNIQTDVLVIGGGMAAAQAAMEARRKGVTVDLVDMGILGESGSSPRSLVGFAAALDELDKEKFFQDWCKTSKYICDQDLVWTAVDNSQDALHSLEAIGVKFIESPNGGYHLNRRAGHTAARGMMVEGGHGDYTNTCKEVRPTAEKLGVRFNEGCLVTKLFVEDGRVIGALAVDRAGEPHVFSAKAVVLAAGGANRFFPNLAKEIRDPKYGTYGSSYCLAFDAGVQLKDMEFTQFRDSPPAGTIFGAPLLNNKGERIMEKYDPVNLEKAPRALVATAVYKENIEGRGPVVWHPDPERDDLLAPVLSEYRNEKVVEINLQFQRCLGGAAINSKAETSLKGLYAVGEASGGVLGSDRMQSVAFLECVIFGMLGGQNAAEYASTSYQPEISPGFYEKEVERLQNYSGSVDPHQAISDLQELMWEKVGVVRSEEVLLKGIEEIERMKQEIIPNLNGSTDLFAALNAETLIRSAEMVARSAVVRKESRGALNREDFPKTSDSWVKHVCIDNVDGKIEISLGPVTVGQINRTWKR